ncbi:MAG TPA: polysaccharide pyruvyl transferase family protein [Candidatus Angelobacter sp.]|nr:polysaccharide pyruvyl transferase family protein [Candidatus Angelobacter sp.]
MDRLTRAHTKIGLLHHVGGGNLGDEATLDAVADNIRRRWPNAEIVAFSMNPDDTETRHGIMSHPIQRKGWSIGYKSAVTEVTLKETVKALTRKHKVIFYLLKAISALIRLPSEAFRELLFLMSSHRIIKPLDLLIISGGGQLTEKDGPWAFPYTIFKWVLLARFAGIKCIFLNVGAGPLTGPLSKFFVRRALLAADYVSLRDDKSRALVCAIGFAGETRVCPDSAYGLELATTNGSPLEKCDQPMVGFAPMPYPDPRWYSAEKDQIVYDEFIRKLAIFASWLVGQSYALTIFGTDIGVDPLAIQDLQANLLSHHGISSSQYGVNRSVKSHDLLAAILRMDYIVTCRFHGVVFAHLLNKPVLAIAHHPKVMDLMTDLELSSYCVDIRDFDMKLLTERFASMVTNAEEIKNNMAASLTRNRQRLKTQFDELFRY